MELSARVGSSLSKMCGADFWREVYEEDDYEVNADDDTQLRVPIHEGHVRGLTPFVCFL